MMKVIQSLSLLSFDARKANTKLNKEFSKILRAGVRIWIETAQENIPVWSGASQSTLQDLAGKVGVNIAVFPLSKAPNRVGLGRSSGKGTLIEKAGFFGFFYATNLAYLIRNETRDMSSAMRGRLKTSTPYRFREKADKAFSDFINSRLQALRTEPILRESFTVKQVRTNG